MRKHILTLITACVTLGMGAQEGLHVRSYWSTYNIPLEEVDSITMGAMSNTDKLPALMASNPDISLFNEALVVTGMADSLNISLFDYSYKGPTEEESIYIGSFTGRHGEMGHICSVNRYSFTAFVEPDSVYAKHGIYNLDDLKTYAAQVYDAVYPADARITDPTDRRNSLNRFVSYHLLEGARDTLSLIAVNMREGLEGCHMIRTQEAYDCYETMMPYSLLKISYGVRADTKHYLNRKYGIYNGDEEYTIAGVSLISEQCDKKAVNGVYHCIDDILCYDYKTQYEVFNSRLTMDITTLAPELTNNSIRHMKENVSTLLPSRMMRNFSYDANQHLLYYPGAIGFWCYQADEMYFFPSPESDGITIKLPPMPAGTYQLCLGVVPMSQRGTVQFYIDGESCGDPVDLRVTNVEGWFADEGLKKEEIIAKENEFRELGWMKGLSDYSCNNTGTILMRSLSNTLRRIVGYYHTDGDTDHYLRIQSVDDVKEMMIDYIQITPKAVYEKELTYPYE